MNWVTTYSAIYSQHDTAKSFHGIGEIVRQQWAKWRRRMNEMAGRRALMAMSDHQLSDIGLVRADLTRDLGELNAEREARRAGSAFVARSVKGGSPS